MAAEVYNSRLFSSHGLCPRVFSVFGNGFSHESAVAANNGSGIALNSDLAVDRSIYPVVACRYGNVPMCHKSMRMSKLLQKLIVRISDTYCFNSFCHNFTELAIP